MRLRSNGFYGGEMIVVYSMNEHAIYIQSVTAFVPKLIQILIQNIQALIQNILCIKTD